MSNDDNEIRYNLASAMPTWVRWLGIVLIPLAIIQIGPFLVRGGPAPILAFGVLAVGALSTFSAFTGGQRVVVGPRGIARPMRRHLPWADVEGVQRPGRFDDVVKVILRSGKSVSTGLPVGYAEQVARIGGKPLVDQVSPLGQK